VLVQQSAYLFTLRLIYMCSLFSHKSRLNQRYRCGCGTACSVALCYLPVANVLTQLVCALRVNLCMHTAVPTGGLHLANKGGYLQSCGQSLPVMQLGVVGLAPSLMLCMSCFGLSVRTARAVKV
jgi:hypothetical protein